MLVDMPHALSMAVHIGHSRASQGRPAGLLPCHVLRWGHLLHNGWPHGRVYLARRMRDSSRHRRKDCFVFVFVLLLLFCVVVVVLFVVLFVVCCLLWLFGGWRRNRRGSRLVGAAAGCAAAAALLAGVRMWREMLLQLLHIHAVLLH